MSRAKKYHTAEERREGARQRHRKYFNAKREAIYARRAKRAKRKQAAIEAVQKGPSARSPQGELEDPAPLFSGDETADGGVSAALALLGPNGKAAGFQPDTKRMRRWSSGRKESF